MSHDKLRDWLNLPEGPWPPNFYVLIGLKEGAGTPEEIEGRVLERMEKIRAYQNKYPDEATEGMNVLAQALDTLLVPDARRIYDKSLGLRPPTRLVESPRLPPADDLNALFPGVPLLPAASEHPILEDGVPLPDAVVLPDVADEADVDDDPEFLDDDQPLALPEAFLLPVPPPVARLEGPGRDDREGRPVGRPKSPRRERYADLARVRKVLRVWERARPLLTDPDRTFSRRADTLALMGCLAELRPLLPTVPDLVGTGRRPGGMVAALARQRLLFDTFRSLPDDERDDLVRDFRAAHYRLAGYYDDLRDEVRRHNEKDWGRAVGRPLVKYLLNHPEWLVLPVGLLALAVAFVRSV